MADFSLAGSPEFWKVDGSNYVVYVVPDAVPEIYLTWSVPSQGDMQSFFGPDQQIVYNREMSAQEYQALGALNFGTSNELANFDDDPFTSWAQTMEVEAQSQPWILEPDYQALIAMAMLEGRGLTDAEVQSTDWWRSASNAEKEWMEVYHGNPAEAQQLLDDNRLRTAQMLTEAGIENPSDQLLSYMADQVTMGYWSLAEFNDQVRAIADPASGSEIRPEVAAIIGDDEPGTTLAESDTVQATVRRWLGPIHGDWSSEQIAEWAGRLRNDPDGATELEQMLQQQRVALYPHIADPTLTYEDIASPWRSFATSIWGQQMDETDPMFGQLLQNNDASLNGQLLRQAGLDQGIGKVVEDYNRATLSALGGSVRRAV